MDLTEVVSIAGKPGLQKIVGRRPSGLIVESLDDRKKRFPSSITEKISILSDISIYTYDGDIPLSEVLKSLHEKVQAGLKLVNKKNSGDEIRSFFREVLPEFDEVQVYTSDIVKLVNWYSILVEFTDFEELLKSEEPDTSEEDDVIQDSNSEEE